MRLVIRADATPSVGAGHVMRCTTLAEAWLAERVGTVTMWGTITLGFVTDRLASIGVGVVARHPGGDILVVDTYDDAIRSESTKITEARLKVLVDDIGGTVDGYDVIWNPNAYAVTELYRGFHGKVISQQVPLRSGLPRWQAQSRRVAVSLGGGIPPRSAVQAIEQWRVRGGATIVTTESDWAPRDWETVPRAEMWTEFASCASMVTAGGATVWEAAAVGIPSCVLITAPNQALVGEWARHNGVPVINPVPGTLPNALTDAVAVGIARSRVLPPVTNGAPDVARMLSRWAA
jgi:UDP-2,4-diacetamido-2,4,6-trideoxy-beta-L-altropyranose hydrolase